MHTLQEFFFPSTNVVSSSASLFGSVVAQRDARADLTGDAEVSAYLNDSDNVPLPSAFHYVSPSPLRVTSPFASIPADSGQSRAASWVDKCVQRQQANDDCALTAGNLQQLHARVLMCTCVLVIVCQRARSQQRIHWWI